MVQGQAEREERGGVPWEGLPGLVVGVQGPGLPTDPAAYEGRMPVEWGLSELPVGSIEDAFAAVIGSNVGWINWEMLCWPESPEARFHGESKHAEVTLLFNTRTRKPDVLAEDYTVLVHVRSAVFGGVQTREPYAHWLAEEVGLTVMGPGQRL
ncbi:hypothetical protein EAO70_07860 [Streptomyces sp. adm13(2018)]|uniref:hypothetical protein n=1 Tax=Streptomyces sp. adm13(2018) TaxID=2479007 RepID=UPI0011CDA1CA|nr:hypothetical protein [Streptomyces sp. adm13(2018)]TXS21328.1 hypothetical protein EAO70_07860 [Streptomyces sp. adm13(2018)]